MQRISRETVIFEMSAQNEPVAHALSGDTVLFETLDCFSNTINREDQLLSTVGWDCINPATGPLFIKEAQPGDILRVEIIDIKLDSQGVMTTAPGFGVLGRHWEEEKTKIISIAGNKALFNDKIELPIKPMIGVIGTAPKLEGVSTGTPGPHGGNMDCKRIGLGSILYLPVNVHGALLAIGDVHANMGDGEIVICGVEIAAEVTVKVDVVKGLALPLPLLLDDEQIMTIASAETLDQAAAMATEMMFSFLGQALDIDGYEIGMLLSAVADLRICQIVDPLMTARMEFPLWILEKYSYRMP